MLAVDIEQQTTYKYGYRGGCGPVGGRGGAGDATGGAPGLAAGGAPGLAADGAPGLAAGGATGLTG